MAKKAKLFAIYFYQDFSKINSAKYAEAKAAAHCNIASLLKEKRISQFTLVDGLYAEAHKICPCLFDLGGDGNVTRIVRIASDDDGRVKVAHKAPENIARIYTVGAHAENIILEGDGIFLCHLDDPCHFVKIVTLASVVIYDVGMREYRKSSRVKSGLYRRRVVLKVDVTFGIIGCESARAVILVIEDVLTEHEILYGVIAPESKGCREKVGIVFLFSTCIFRKVSKSSRNNPTFHTFPSCNMRNSRPDICMARGRKIRVPKAPTLSPLLRIPRLRLPRAYIFSYGCGNLLSFLSPSCV